MKKIFSTLIVGLVLISFVAGIVNAQSGRTVVDSLDREVTVQGVPERVVTTIVSTTEIALDLGLDDRLVGVPDLVQYLSYVPELQKIAEKKEKVGGFKLSLEKIASLEPDLVILDASAQKEMIGKIKDTGATVYAAGSRNIESVRETILEIGYLTGKLEAAKDIVGEMVYKQVRLKDAVGKLEEKRELFYTISKRMYTAGDNTFVGQALQLAGLNNVFGEISGYKPVSTEEIIQRNPELIIATEDMGLSVEHLRQDKGLKGVKAVKEGNVVLLPTGDDSMLNQPGTRIIDGAINLFEKIYDREVNL